MKLKILLFILFCIFSFQLRSQSTYDFLTKPDLTFASQYFNFGGPTHNLVYKFVQDTVVCDENLLLYQYSPPSNRKKLLRVEGGKVWLRDFNNPCIDKKLLFNFDMELGDKPSQTSDFVVTDIGTYTLFNGEERKKITLTREESNHTYDLVDGIGYLGGGLFPIQSFEGYTNLICVKDNNETIILSSNISSELCDSLSCFAPVPNFNFEVDKYQVNFQNLSMNQSFVHWDFGDGETSTELNPSHLYKASGCYTVTLSLSSDCLSRTFEKKLTVNICIPQEWKENPLDFINNISLVDFVSESVGWIISNNQIWKTEDGGTSWTEQFYPIPAPPIKREFTSIDMVDELHGVISLINYSAPETY